MDNLNPEKKRYKSIAVWGFVALLSALMLAQLASDYIANMFFGLLGALMPVLLAVALAYLLKKLVNYLEEKPFKNLFKEAKNRKVKVRVFSISLIFVVLLLILTLIIMSLIPAITEIATLLATNSEQYIENLTTQLTELSSNISWLNSVEVQESIAEGINNLAINIENYLPEIVDQALQIATSTTIIIGNVLISFILAFLMLKDKERIGEFIKRMSYANLKTFRADNLIKTARKGDKILYSYFIGKVIEASIILLVVGVGFYFLGVPYSFVLASIIAILNFIPYVGALLALIPVLILTIIFASVNTALWALIYAGGMLILITSTISPFIFGKQLNISALLIILSIILGGGMFGIWGMLFAPPAVAIITVLITENIKQKEEMKLLAKSHGLTEEDLLNEELLIEAGKIVKKRKTAETKKPKK